jgi:hypothetical protein
MDRSKEEALNMKMKDLREPGFSTYRGEMEDKIEPKFVINTFYPKYLSYYELQSDSKGSNNTTTNNTETNNTVNNNTMNGQEINNMGNINNNLSGLNNKKINNKQ